MTTLALIKRFLIVLELSVDKLFKFGTLFAQPCPGRTNNRKNVTGAVRTSAFDPVQIDGNWALKHQPVSGGVQSRCPHRGVENRTPHEAFLAFAVLTKNETLNV